MVDFKVSVVIPIYNSANFLEKAVMSALALDEVGEVILVDDGSSDSSLDLCRELAKQHNRLKVLQHDDKNNHGVSASRNLGIKNTRFSYIAFLDSDDYYLPNRFTKAKDIFGQDNKCDGVYDAAQYEDNFRAGNQQLYTISEPLLPSDLFYWLLSGKKGYFCTDAVTIKKCLLEKTGFFLEDIRMHEDSELWLRLAFHGKLLAGNLGNPVAIVRRHATNAIKARSQKTLLEFYEVIRNYYSDKSLTKSQKQMMLTVYWRSRSLNFSNEWIRRLYFYFFFYINFIRLNLRLV